MRDTQQVKNLRGVGSVKTTTAVIPRKKYECSVNTTSTMDTTTLAFVSATLGLSDPCLRGLPDHETRSFEMLVERIGPKAFFIETLLCLLLIQHRLFGRSVSVCPLPIERLK